MKVGKVHIVFTWLPFGQGFCLTNRLIFIEPVKDRIYGLVHVDSTCDLIQHELDHPKKIDEMIEKKGVMLAHLDFWFTSLFQYLFIEHDKAAYEPRAERAEKEPNHELAILLKEYLIKKKLLFY